MSLGPLLRRSRSPRAAFLAGAAAGALATVLTAGLVCLALALSGPEYVPALGLVLASYGPLALIEAALGGAAAGFLRQVKPELLGAAGA
jgi:cobalt/nickel transport system permease protein